MFKGRVRMGVNCKYKYRRAVAGGGYGRIRLGAGLGGSDPSPLN